MKLVWDKVGERFYETGCDHGVLYPIQTGGKYNKGVAWNGLSAVTESPSGAEPSPTVACSSGAGTGLNRRELYTDARDVSSTVDNETLTDAEYKAQLSQRGLENLAENIATKSFEGKVETTRMYRYGEDFFLGDMVQIVNEYGIEGKARVTEFIRSQSKEGLDSYPTFVTVE